MKLTKEQKAIFRQSYQICIDTFIKDATNHQEIFLDEVEKSGTYEHDMSDLAITGFLYNMRKFQKFNSATQSLIDEAKTIIKNRW